MDSSEPSKAVIDLGKRIVAEVGIGDDERDTLGRWLAHDLAQKIKDAEDLRGPEGVAAREACTTAILKLWEHRAVFPRSQRPFANVETALKILERLDPANSANRYFQPPRRPPAKDDWLETATAVDRAARVILRACARLAVEDDSGRASAFVKIAEKAGLQQDPDMGFVRIILMSGKAGEGDEAEKLRAEARDALKTFSRAAKKVREALAAEEAAAAQKILTDPGRRAAALNGDAGEER